MVADSGPGRRTRPAGAGGSGGWATHAAYPDFAGPGNAGLALPLCHGGIACGMLDQVQAFLVVLEEGSINRAALRLRLAQPALSRQMQALEHEVGGRLLERRTSGVVPTGLGHALARGLRPVLAAYAAALAEVRREARGQRSELRIGYLMTIAQSLLTPALDRLRREQPDLQLQLHDFSPREQIAALREGRLDVALTGQEGAGAARDFHSRRLGSFGVCAALARSDPLAGRRGIRLRELKGHRFVGIDEEEMPGRNRWMKALCRAAGFTVRFAVIADGITNVLSLVVSENAVTLVPAYLANFPHPGIRLVPVRDAGAAWDLIVLWQRGKVPDATRALIDALTAEAPRLDRRRGAR